MPKVGDKTSGAGQRPKLVNRGPAGLLKKLPEGELKQNGEQAEPEPKGKQNNIQCEGTVVEIGSLVPDPDNARLHPERNMAAIKGSLILYGQRIPLVVRKQDMKVAAGNGRLRGMTELGWTRCAVSMRPMTDEEFAGFALADNRTAELAQWDFEVVARIDRLLGEAKRNHMVGWTMDELEVLRMADWTPPQVSDEEYNGSGEAQVHKCPACGHEWTTGGGSNEMGNADA